MKSREGYHVHGKFPQISVQLSWEPKEDLCSDIAQNLFKFVQILSLEVTSPIANLWSLEILKWQNLHTVPQAGGDTGHDG